MATTANDGVSLAAAMLTALIDIRRLVLGNGRYASADCCSGGLEVEVVQCGAWMTDTCDRSRQKLKVRQPGGRQAAACREL